MILETHVALAKRSQSARNVGRPCCKFLFAGKSAPVLLILFSLSFIVQHLRSACIKVLYGD
jgi:hypothetical protein